MRWIIGDTESGAGPSRKATEKVMETTLQHLREMTKKAEHEMHAIVMSCKRARKQTLAALPAKNPRLH